MLSHVVLRMNHCAFCQNLQNMGTCVSSFEAINNLYNTLSSLSITLMPYYLLTGGVADHLVTGQSSGEDLDVRHVAVEVDPGVADLTSRWSR